MVFFEGPRGCPFSFTVIVSQSCVKQTGFQAGLAGCLIKDKPSGYICF